MKRNPFRPSGFRFQPSALVCVSVLLLCRLAFCGEIHEATRASDVEKVKALLKANPELVNDREKKITDIQKINLLHPPPDIEGFTPLHWAAAWQRKEVAEVLLANNADVNAKDKDGRTPLYYAIWNGPKERETAKLLLANKADIDARDNKGRSLLHLALATGKKDIADFLSQHGAKKMSVEEMAIIQHEMAEYAIFHAAEVGDVEQVKTELKVYPELVNARDEQYGMTPLHWAASRGFKIIVELLLANKADVNAKSSEGMTPFCVAANSRNKDAAELLLTHGANPNAKDNKGWTPLHHAIFYNNKETVAWLLANKADINERLPDNWADVGAMPLHEAVFYGRKEVVEILLTHNAEVDAKSKSGRTPLHTAAMSGEESKVIAEMLLTHKADVNATDKGGHTPLHFLNNKAVAELLLANKADVNVKDNQDKTPLHFVREWLELLEKNSPESKDVERVRGIVELLRQHGAKE